MSSHYTSTHQRTRQHRRTVGPPGRRLKMLRGSLLVVFALIGLRLVMLQIFDHGRYAVLSVAQVHEDLTTSALRGGIFDRSGKILAISRPTSLVIADDFQIKSPAKEAAAMSHIVGVPVKKLTALLSQNNGYVIINNQLDLKAGHQLASMMFPGIVVQNSSVRSYPNGWVATSVLGGVNAAGVGSAGLESKFQGTLAGQSGLTRAFVSASGVNLPSSYSRVLRKAKPGVGLELTLDSSLQFVAERALAHQLATTDAVSGVVVVMDVKTGEILANASLVNTKANAGILGPMPTWGQPLGIPGIQQSLNNLAFTQAYEPGSVFKIVAFSAALQAGLITPSTPFSVPYAVNVGGRYFHDAERHGLEHLSATQVLAQSSNIGTYEVASRVGEAGLLAQVQRLGFGSRTAVDFPGETSGLLINAANWYSSDKVALPIGQVDAVPAIQILDAYNTIANGGVFVEPKLIGGYVNTSGTLKLAPPSASHVALSPTVAATMNGMLEQVVLAGTGTNAIIPGYRVAGKTGTASIPYPGRAKLLNGAYNASFVGYAPANAPALSMIVVIQRPRTTIFGGAVAAPVFQKVMSYALHHFKIPSNGTMVKPLKGASASVASDVT